MRAVAGNVVSDKVPGGSLIAGVLDRRVMMWSDRGGASRYLGERWSEQCTAALESWVGTPRPVPGGAPYTLECVVRLDENPEIAIQAGRHQLVNPDFVLYGRRGAEHVLQAADAKFAVDTAKSPQVSAAALEALLAVEGGLVRQAIEARLGGPLAQEIRVERGVFLSPISPLTDYFLPRVTGGPHPTVERREVILIPVDPVAMFAGLPMTALIGMLARIDRLPVAPRRHILSAIYYFRLACACAWLWTEERTPLLSLALPPALDAESLRREVDERSEGATTAFGFVERWAEEVEEIRDARKTLSEVAALPVPMRDLRRLAEQAGRGAEPKLVRQTRAALERRYRRRLVEEVGEVPARPERPLPEILEEVASASHRLEPELRRLASELISSDGAAPRD